MEELLTYFHFEAWYILLCLPSEMRGFIGAGMRKCAYALVLSMHQIS